MHKDYVTHQIAKVLRSEGPSTAAYVTCHVYGVRYLSEQYFEALPAVSERLGMMRDHGDVLCDFPGEPGTSWRLPNQHLPTFTLNG